MSGPQILLEKEDNWETEMGAWFAGERVVFRGLDLFTELFDKSWMETWFFAITGRWFEQKQIELFGRMWTLCTSYPEPRIWNNRVAALTGSARSTAMLGLSAAVAVSDAKYYGGQANLASVDFIKRAKQWTVDQGGNLETMVLQEIKETRQIPVGFGRPIINCDERVPPVLQLASELGFDNGPHVKLALEIEHILRDTRYRAVLNIGGLTAALSADQGLSPKEFYQAASVIYSAGIMACYMDAESKEPGTFFPLRCERVAYQGVGARKWKNEEKQLE